MLEAFVFPILHVNYHVTNRSRDLINPKVEAQVQSVVQLM